MSLILPWLPGLIRRLGAVVLLGWLGGVGIALAGGQEATPARLVALAADNATGSLYKAEANAVYQSDDQGLHWRRLPMPAIDNGGRIAAVASRKGVLYLAGPGLGVQRSDDGGRHWTVRSTGLPGLQVTAFALHADRTDTLYAYVATQGIYRSEDAGQTWKLMDRGPHERILQFVHSNMPGSMQNGWLFAATTNGVGRSMDCFCGWRAAGDLKGTATAVTYDPGQPQQVYAALGSRLFLSQDGGEQWSTVPAPSPAVTTLLAAPNGVLYAGDKKGQLFSSSDHAQHWERVHA